MSKFIVMTSIAKMPLSVKARYRNVAIVELTDIYAANNWIPKFIGLHARGVASIVHLGRFYVGKTAKSAYARALIYAAISARNMSS